MALSAAEQTALDEMKAANEKEKLSMYQQMRYLAQCDEKGLAACGYRNGLGDALIRVLKETERVIQKNEKEFLKKFPD